MLCVVSSCATNILNENYLKSKGTSVYFKIYSADGYFYNKEGFILVKHDHENYSTVMIKCKIDTIYVQNKKR